MNTSFYSGFGEIYMQSCIVGIDLYSQLLRNAVQLYSIEVLSGESRKDTTHQVLPFQGKHTPAYNGSHHAVFYDFAHHHSVSREEWSAEMRGEYNRHHHAIFQQFIRDTEKIEASFLKYHKQFLLFAYQFISHLLNPLFQEFHYRQFRRKHIGVQGKENNVIYAFTFSPEEMALYSELDSLRSSWEEIRKNLITGLSDVIGYLEEIHPVFERIRLFDPAIESICGENWGRDMRSGVSGFMNEIELSNPESYFLFKKEYLEKTHKGLKEVLAQ